MAHLVHHSDFLFPISLAVRSLQAAQVSCVITGYTASVHSQIFRLEVGCMLEIHGMFFVVGDFILSFVLSASLSRSCCCHGYPNDTYAMTFDMLLKHAA